MALALEQAALAARNNEVPVGAVLVNAHNQVIAACGNQTISNCDPTGHAEIMALRQGAQVAGNYRLLNSTLYVTLEPCAMCAGALIWARVKRVVFAAYDEKAGSLGSVLCLHRQLGFNHKLEVSGGILEQQSVALLQDFFRRKR